MFSKIIVPELRDDVLLIGDCEKLQQEGIMLVDASNECAGRVIFSLQEVPMRINFTTPNNNRLQRVSDNRVYVATPNEEHKYKIEISRAITHVNKDQFLWAQSQSDLCILNNQKLLANSGVTLREQITGETLRIFSLKDLPIGTKYFTENDNVLQRKSANEVQVADKILYLSPNKPDIDPSEWDCDCSYEGTSFKLEVVDNSTPTGKLVGDSNPGAMADSIASQLLQSKDFPKASSCTIVGSGFHGSLLEVKCAYEGGVEGNSSIRWEISTERNPAFVPIKKATSKHFTPSINEIGASIRVAYTPVRADGVTGMIVFSRPVQIKIDPLVKSEVESNLAMSTIMFKVLLRNGKEFQKRSILLNRTKVKVRKRRTTITKMKYSSYLDVKPEVDDCMFTLELSSADQHVFMTPSSYQRDIIVLTIKAFNADIL